MLYLKLSFRMTFSDLEWLRNIFNDMKHSAASLQQLSFLFSVDGIFFTLKRNCDAILYAKTATGFNLSGGCRDAPRECRRRTAGRAGGTCPVPGARGQGRRTETGLRRFPRGWSCRLPTAASDGRGWQTTVMDLSAEYTRELVTQLTNECVNMQRRVTSQFLSPRHKSGGFTQRRCPSVCWFVRLSIKSAAEQPQRHQGRYRGFLSRKEHPPPVKFMLVAPITQRTCYCCRNAVKATNGQTNGQTNRQTPPLRKASLRWWLILLLPLQLVRDISSSVQAFKRRILRASLTVVRGT